MFIYLNESYPDVYIYRCKFGDVLYDDVSQMIKGCHISRSDVVKKLTLLFSCEELDAYDVFDNWKASRPVYVAVTNSTNETVLAPLKTELNTTAQYLSYMKYIITEEQFDRVLNEPILFWVKRRYDLVKASLEETFEYMEFDICRIDDYEKFEKKFFSVLMDCLHPYFYDNDTFGDDSYDVLYSILQDLYYVECTEFYFKGREKC